MTKKVISTLLCALILFSFGACKKADSSELPYYNYNLSPYITLGEYKGVKVDKFMTTATETEIDNAVNEYMEQTKFYLAVTDRASQKGDFVDITFEGTINGESFENGSGTMTVELGNSTLIEGFEEGLYDKKAEDHITLNLTFPEDYSETSIAGKPVVFEVDIDEVKISVEPEVSDSFLAAHTEYKTVADLREALRSDIEQSKIASEASVDQGNLFEKLLENSTFPSLPEKDIERYKELMADSKTQYETYASYYGMELDAFIKLITEDAFETYDAYLMDNINSRVKSDLLIASVAKKENITWAQEEYDAMLKDYASYGYESKEAFLKETDNGAAIKWSLLYNTVLDFLMDNAVFVDSDGNVVVRTTPTPVPTTAASPSSEE